MAVTLRGLSPDFEAQMLDCGFTVGELRQAFDLVQNATDWKEPIDSHVTEDELKKTLHAIIFFTGTEPTTTEVATKVNGKKVYRVQSVGYRNGPAGP